MSEIEPFVDAERASTFLGLQRRRLLQMARAGEVPAHPIGTGPRRTWRFRLSELSEAIVARQSQPGYEKPNITIKISNNEK